MCIGGNISMINRKFGYNVMEGIPPKKREFKGLSKEDASICKAMEDVRDKTIDFFYLNEIEHFN